MKNVWKKMLRGMALVGVGSVMVGCSAVSSGWYGANPACNVGSGCGGGDYAPIGAIYDTSSGCGAGFESYGCGQPAAVPAPMISAPMAVPVAIPAPVAMPVNREVSSVGCGCSEPGFFATLFGGSSGCEQPSPCEQPLPAWRDGGGCGYGGCARQVQPAPAPQAGGCGYGGCARQMQPAPMALPDPMQPIVIRQKPIVVDQPTLVVRQPPIRVKQPPIRVKNPPVIIEQPQVMVNPPRIKVEAPKVLVEKPAVSVEKPSVSFSPLVSGCIGAACGAPQPVMVSQPVMLQKPQVTRPSSRLMTQKQ